MIPLVLAPLNEELKIVKIAVNEKEKRYLESLGISINEPITVLASSGGTVVCKVKDGRIGLDHNFSTKIFV